VNNLKWIVGVAGIATAVILGNFLNGEFPTFGPEKTQEKGELNRRDPIRSNRLSVSASDRNRIKTPAGLDLADELKNADDLARQGNFAEALAGYLRCWDEGNTGNHVGQSVRRSFLLRAVASLGNHYPPALAALHQRRDQAEKTVLDNKTNRDAPKDLAVLNQILGEEMGTFELYDRLPSSDHRRLILIPYVYERLVAAQRYSEAAQAKPYLSASQVLGRVVVSSNIDYGKTIPSFTGERRIKAISQVATSIEVLAAIGDLAHAKELAGRMLSIDGSEMTRSILKKHAARVEHLELIPLVKI
jgi:hypothetical protein